MDMDFFVIATVCFVAHGLIGSIDGAYFHLHKFRLHTHEETFFEHQLHTLRALFLALTSVIFFALNTGGWLLWIGAVLLAADLVVLTWDVWIERKSRESLGGLLSKEYLVHVHATILHTASFILVIAAKPVAAWALDSPPLLETELPMWCSLCGWAIAISAGFSSLQHLWYWRPSYRTSPSPEGPSV